MKKLKFRIPVNLYNKLKRIINFKNITNQQMKKNLNFHKVKTSKISDKTNIHGLDLNLIAVNKLLGLSAVFVAML